MLENQSMDNKEKCEFNMTSCFSYWTNTLYASPAMYLMCWPILYFEALNSLFTGTPEVLGSINPVSLLASVWLIVVDCHCHLLKLDIL